jgi:hypothetical protein
VRSSILPLVFLVVALAVALGLFFGRGQRSPSGLDLDYRGGRLDGGTALRVLRLAGTPREKGEAHGRLLKADIRAAVQRLRPREEGLREFALKTCGDQLLPHLPGDVRAELEGIAEGAGISLAEALYLNTRFELASFRLGGGADLGVFHEDAAVGDGPEVLRRFGTVQARAFCRDLILVVHEDELPCLVMVALPGMVGGFMGVRGPVAAALRPVRSESKPVLTGVPWPVLVRALLVEPPRVGRPLPAPTTRAASVPMRRTGGALGVLNVTPAGATWFPRDEYALSNEDPVTGLGPVTEAEVAAATRSMAEERARRFLLSDTPEGSVAVRLKGGAKGVSVALELPRGAMRQVVRFGE